MGIIINDPFLECAKGLDLNRLAVLDNYGEVENYWEKFSRKVTPINNKLMRESDCLLAILDGGHAIDDGGAGEIGYYAGGQHGPIFALRSDWRGGENIGAAINPQIWGYILMSGGCLVDGANALENWFKRIEEWKHGTLSFL